MMEEFAVAAILAIVGHGGAFLAIVAVNGSINFLVFNTSHFHSNHSICSFLSRSLRSLDSP